VQRELTAEMKAAYGVKIQPLIAIESKKRMVAGKGEDGSGGRGNAKNPVADCPQGLEPHKSRDKAARAR
jgi:hypothetical protein